MMTNLLSFWIVSKRILVLVAFFASDLDHVWDADILLPLS